MRRGVFEKKSREQSGLTTVSKTPACVASTFDRPSHNSLPLTPAPGPNTSYRVALTDPGALGNAPACAASTLTPRTHAFLPLTPAPGPCTSYRVALTDPGASGDVAARVARRVARESAPHYVHSGAVAQRVKISPRALGRLTSNLWVTEGDDRCVF